MNHRAAAGRSVVHALIAMGPVAATSDDIVECRPAMLEARHLVVAVIDCSTMPPVARSTAASGDGSACYGIELWHRWNQDRLDTLANVRAAGVSVCAGGIIGLGEGEKDRVGLIHQVVRRAAAHHLLRAALGSRHHPSWRMAGPGASPVLTFSSQDICCMVQCWRRWRHMPADSRWLQGRDGPQQRLPMSQQC